MSEPCAQKGLQGHAAPEETRAQKGHTKEQRALRADPA